MDGLVLETSSFFPCYQPIVDLVSGEIGGYEALARTRDAAGNIRSAGHIFTAGGSRDAVVAIDRNLRRQALGYFAEHTQAGYITLNISPDWIDLLQGDVLPTIAMVREAGIHPERVVIEITERHGNIEKLGRAVAAYHRAGLRVAVDDFGAGASQIDRIIDLRPDIIKLDMQIFKRAARGGVSADVVLAATTIAGRVGCEIVCEGVETEEELHFGIECGARFIQGFYFSPALTQVLPPRDTYSSARAVQQSFLRRKTDRLKQVAIRSQAAGACVMSMREAFIAKRGDDLSPQQLWQAGVLRYYLCRSDGTQISDNVDVTPDGFVRVPCPGDYNWSHRPYFALLLALESSSRELVVSNSYRDASSNQLCKTYGALIRDDQVLLVDVAVEDEILYAPIGDSMMK